MPKFTYKIRTADYWDIEQYESWFADMSLKGLHVRKLGTRFIKFEKGEPQRFVYRIAITKTKSVDLAQATLYKENGWSYVTSAPYIDLFSAAEGQAQEVELDSATQRGVLKHIQSKLTTSLILVSFGVLIYLALLAVLWLMGGVPTLRLIEGQVVTQTLLGFILFYGVFEQVRALRKVRRLQAGSVAAQPVSWEACWKINRIRFSGYVIFTLCALTIPVTQLMKMEYRYASASDIDEPYIQLEHIVKDGQLVYEEDEPYRYSTNWSLFAPVQYEVMAYGVVIGAEQQEQSATIETSVYHLRFQALVVPLMNDLMKWYAFGDESVTAVTVQHRYFDHLLLHEGPQRKEFAASKGKRVVYVQYYGEASMDVLVAEAEQLMKDMLKE